MKNMELCLYMYNTITILQNPTPKYTFYPPTLHPTAFPHYLCFKVQKIHKGANMKKIKQLIKKVNFKYQFVAKENIVL